MTASCDLFCACLIIIGLSRLPLADRKKTTAVAEMLYYSQEERAPVTAAQVCKGTHNGSVLSRIMEIIMRGQAESDDLEVNHFISHRISSFDILKKFNKKD